MKSSASSRRVPIRFSAQRTWSLRPSIRSSTGSRANLSVRRVEAYRRAAASKSDLDRTDLAKTKTGVFIGAFATNPVNGKSIPIWIADYVLMGYGTGAIMAVPGHDERDFAFARAFELPIVRVVASSLDRADEPLDEAEAETGICCPLA